MGEKAEKKVSSRKTFGTCTFLCAFIAIFVGSLLVAPVVVRRAILKAPLDLVEELLNIQAGTQERKKTQLGFER